MRLREVQKILDAEVLVGADKLEMEVRTAFGADMMSDVLASIQPEAVLLTGLCNPQVVRTSVMADVAAIVIVRGKKPMVETLELAEKEKIPLISSPYGMFALCGRLYAQGMVSLERPVDGSDCDCGAQ